MNKTHKIILFVILSSLLPFWIAYAQSFGGSSTYRVGQRPITIEINNTFIENEMRLNSEIGSLRNNLKIFHSNFNSRVSEYDVKYQEVVENQKEALDKINNEISFIENADKSDFSTFINTLINNGISDIAIDAIYHSKDFSKEIAELNTAQVNNSINNVLSNVNTINEYQKNIDLKIPDISLIESQVELVNSKLYSYDESKLRPSISYLTNKVTEGLQNLETTFKNNGITETFFSTHKEVHEALDIAESLISSDNTDLSIDDLNALKSSRQNSENYFKSVGINKSGWSSNPSTIKSVHQNWMNDLEDKSVLGKMKKLSFSTPIIGQQVVTSLLNQATLLNSKISAERASINNNPNVELAKSSLNHGLVKTYDAAFSGLDDDLLDAEHSLAYGMAVLTDIGLSFQPLVSPLKSVYEIVTGSNLITGEKISFNERALSLALLPLDFFNPAINPKHYVKGLKSFNKLNNSKYRTFRNIFKSTKAEEVVQSAEKFDRNIPTLLNGADSYSAKELEQYATKWKNISRKFPPDHDSGQYIEDLAKEVLAVSPKLGNKYAPEISSIDDVVSLEQKFDGRNFLRYSKEAVNENSQLLLAGPAFSGPIEKGYLIPGDVIFRVGNKGGSEYGDFYTQLLPRSASHAEDLLNINMWGNKGEVFSAYVVQEKTLALTGRINMNKFKHVASTFDVKSKDNDLISLKLYKTASEPNTIGVSQIYIPKATLYSNIKNLDEGEFSLKNQKEVFNEIKTTIYPSVFKKIFTQEFK